MQTPLSRRFCPHCHTMLALADTSKCSNCGRNPQLLAEPKPQPKFTNTELNARIRDQLAFDFRREVIN